MAWHVPSLNHIPPLNKERFNGTDRKVAGVEVLGVSAESLRAHTTFTEKYHLPFPLLSDADKQVATAYGAWGDKRVRGRTVIGMKRMTFLIDASGMIQHIWAMVKPAGHAAEVLAAVQAKAGTPPAG
jgi:peroxiredoxin Q/BCP